MELILACLHVHCVVYVVDMSNDRWRKTYGFLSCPSGILEEEYSTPDGCDLWGWTWYIRWLCEELNFRLPEVSLSGMPS